MENKKEPTPRAQGTLVIKENVFKKYIKEMEETNKKYYKTEEGIKFSLLQKAKEKRKIINDIFGLAYFYDQNFTSNKDFMHIPNIQQITENMEKYPIILAKQKNKYGIEEIIGATTIKIENNNSILTNPFFPTKNENILSITGILAKQNTYDVLGNKIRGIGRQLFKSAIKGAYEINKKQKVRLICEIDCRNENSFKSICNAVKELKEEKIKLELNLVGYYEIINMQNDITEAPTFLFEIKFDNENKLECEKTIFSYENIKTDEFTQLYNDLTHVINQKTIEERKYINLYKGDFVLYHEIQQIDALNMEINSGTTALGNDRVPLTKSVKIEMANVI